MTPTETQQLFESLDDFFNLTDSLFHESMALKALIKIGAITSEELRNTLYGIAPEWMEDNDFDTVETEEEGIDCLYQYFTQDNTSLFDALDYHEGAYGAPTLEEWIRSQPFQTIVEYIEFQKEQRFDTDLSELAQSNAFENLETFKYYESDWHDRLRTLIPMYQQE